MFNSFGLYIPLVIVLIAQYIYNFLSQLLFLFIVVLYVHVHSIGMYSIMYVCIHVHCPLFSPFFD